MLHKAAWLLNESPETPEPHSSFLSTFLAIYKYLFSKPIVQGRALPLEIIRALRPLARRDPGPEPRRCCHEIKLPSASGLPSRPQASEAPHRREARQSAHLRSCSSPETIKGFLTCRIHRQSGNNPPAPQPVFVCFLYYKPLSLKIDPLTPGSINWEHLPFYLAE